MTVAEVKAPLKFEEYAELYEYVEEVIGNLSQDLFEDILDSGIESIEQFEDAYSGCHEGSGFTSPEEQFVEELISDCGYLERDLPDFIANHIDYQAIWDCELRYDHFTIEYNGTTYFFSNQF